MVQIVDKDKLNKEVLDGSKSQDPLLLLTNGDYLEDEELEDELLDEVLDLLYSKRPGFEDLSLEILKILE